MGSIWGIKNTQLLIFKVINDQKPHSLTARTLLGDKTQDFFRQLQDITLAKEQVLTSASRILKIGQI